MGPTTLLYFLLSCVACIGASAWAVTYVVRKGDTLSKVIQENIPGRIYGKNGNLSKILVQNPDVKNLDLIFPGQTISLDGHTLVFSDGSERTPANETSQASAPVDSKGASREFSRIQLHAAFYQSRLIAIDSANGSRSVLGSAFSPEISSRWEQHWESGFTSFLGAHVRLENFKTTSNVHRLTDTTPTLFGFEAGAKIFSYGSSGVLSGSLALDQESFIRAKSVAELTVDAVSVPKAKLQTGFDWFRSRIFRLGSEFEVSYLAPMSSDTYQTKSGFGLGAALLIRQDTKKTPIFGGVRVQYQKQDTTIARQSYLNAGLTFGFHFDWLGD